MIGYLEGPVRQLDEETWIVVAGKVGYVFSCSARTAHTLREGQEACLWIETLWRREASPQLIAFAEREEQLCFCWLMTVQGVGSRVALSLLSLASPGQIVQWIEEGQKKCLSNAEGVGPRLAARLVTELGPRVGMLRNALSRQGLGWEKVNFLDSSPKPASDLQESLRSALSQLGYTAREYEAVVQKVNDDKSEESLESALRKALQELQGRRS